MKLDNSGPVSAIPTPDRKEVNIINGVAPTNNRSPVPNPIRIKASTMAPSFPHLLLSLTENGANMPIHNTGSVVNRLAVIPLKPRSCCMVLISGEMDVMGGLKFSEARISAKTI
ncbi:major facilitator family transporter [Paenibacillus amylolyticus]|uniref:Major facilitator family transporter n=1 Tax=Paenibacillus amylolyticus TaxID=1451 RepID=A0A117I2H3_PAEAM|nr:major facilitator family transporter [Paenibacillus amylolyticus]